MTEQITFDDLDPFTPAHPVPLRVRREQDEEGYLRYEAYLDAQAEAAEGPPDWDEDGGWAYWDRER